MSAHPCATVMQESPQILIRAAAKFGMTKFRATLPRQSLAIYWARRGRGFCKRRGGRYLSLSRAGLSFHSWAKADRGRPRPPSATPDHPRPFRLRRYSSLFPADSLSQSARVPSSLACTAHARHCFRRGHRSPFRPSAAAAAAAAHPNRVAHMNKPPRLLCLPGPPPSLSLSSIPRGCEGNFGRDWV